MAELFLSKKSNRDAIDLWNRQLQNVSGCSSQLSCNEENEISDSPADNFPEIPLKDVIRQWHSRLSLPSYPVRCADYSPQGPVKISITEDSSALNGYLKCYKIEKNLVEISPAIFLRDTTEALVSIIKHSIEQLCGVKLWISLVVQFEKATDALETMKAYFGSDTVRFLQGSVIQQNVDHMCQKILGSVESFQQNGSGWVIKKVLSLHANFVKYSPLRGSSYVALPTYISKKKAVINVRNADNMCFKWAVLSAIHPQPSNAHRVAKYLPFQNELNFRGISFPVRFPDIPRFEGQNNLSINVYGYENFLFPLYMSQVQGRKISLLYYKDHYCFIKGLDRLLSDQNEHNGRKYVCPYCLFAFYNKIRLDDHVRDCQSDNPCRIQMPNGVDCILKFSNIHKMLRQVLVIYADFECLTEKIQTCASDPKLSSTVAYQFHKPCGYGLVEVRSCCDNISYGSANVFRGSEAVSEFLKKLLQLAEAHQDFLSNSHALSLTYDQECEFKNACYCHICGEGLDQRVRDHCHICGRYRGAAHNKCNQMYRLNGDVVVVFHNLRRYDGHLLMQEIGSVCNERGLTVDCIARGMEDYVMFSIRRCQNGRRYRIKFIDSCQFLLSSLENLVSILAPENFSAMRSHFEDDRIQLMLRKGIYPYDYMDSWERFEETALPSKENFFSNLSEEHISDEDYNHACAVWNTFGIENLGQYHDLYLKTDVLLLADVFENFRTFGLRRYGLDPCHYVTLPSMAWDACLKLTRVQLELLSEPDMYLFFERGIRGGVSVISHRYAKANNPLLHDFDDSLPTSYIIYLDANNLYGWSMVNYLPHSKFRWLTEQEVSELDWRKIPVDSQEGYVLEVDLYYPEALHTAHDSYPLAAEKLRIQESLLSPYCKNLLTVLNKKPVEQEKLVPNLLPKTNYIVHYRNLQLYGELGLNVTKVHRVIAFHQEPWMKPYIEFNTEMRKRATSAFQRDMLKLFNNAVFGKTCENQRNRKDVKLPTKQKQFCKLVANPRYERSCAFNETLAGVVMTQKSIMLNKPIYAGFAVLDLSKLLMYNFHYKYMVPRYKTLSLLFTDTDSLCYHMQTKDIYRDMYQDIEQFDTSDYPSDHFLFSNHNKKVLGMMKDETAGEPISEFIGLRPKMYSFLCRGVSKQRAKGIKKSVVRKRISHQEYLAILREQKEQKNSMNLIRSQRHRMYSLTLNKTSLSCYDDKRYLLWDGITSFAYGNVQCHHTASCNG